MNGLLGLSNLFTASQPQTYSGYPVVAGGGTIAGASPSVTTPVATTSRLGQAYLALNGLSALSTIASGVSGIFATQSEASRLNQQADIALQQARRDALQTALNVKQFREQQAEAYNNSGVTLEGSPMDVMTRTITQGRQEIDAISKQGIAQSNLLRLQASQTKRQGILNATSSVVGAGVNIGAGLLVGNRVGVFGNTPAALTLGGP